MKIGKILTAAVVLLMLSTLIFIAPAALAEEPPPEDPSQPWTPPDVDGGDSLPGGGEGFLSEGGAPPAPGAQCAIMSAFMQDQLGNGKTEFIGNEQIYFEITLAVQNIRTNLWMAEYFPTGTFQAHWLIYGWTVPASGTWRFGPYYAQPFEPEGIHTWHIWLHDTATGYQDHYLVRFEYLSEEPEPEEAETPAEPTDITTSISVTLSSTSIGTNETVTVFGTVNPASNANVMLEQSQDGVMWIPIGSGTATGTTIGQFTPTEAGSYFIRGKASEYLDSDANKNYLAAESSPVMLEVTGRVAGWVIGLAAGLGTLAGVMVWLWRTKRITFGRPA